MFPPAAVNSFVSSSEMSTANTCCEQMLRLAVMTSSALLHMGKAYTLLACALVHPN